MDRFGNNYGTWNIDKGGFGEYKFDKNGNIIFDTNRNDIYNDNWGSDGIDNDNDGEIDEVDESDFVINYGRLPKIIKDANDDGIDDYPDFNVRNLRYDFRLDWEHGRKVCRKLNSLGRSY